MVNTRKFSEMDADTLQEGNQTAGLGSSGNNVIMDVNLQFSPSGTTAERPVAPAEPTIRYNTDTNEFEFWNGTDWLEIASISAGGVNGNVQFNNMGITDGDPHFNTDGAGNVDIDGSLAVDNLQIDGNKISSLDTDGHINLDPNGLGMVLVGGGVPSIGLQADIILFNIAEDAKTAYILPASYSNTSNFAPIYLTEKSRSEVVGNHVAVQENDALSYWAASGDDGTSFRSAVRIVSRVDGPVSTNIVPGRYTIQTMDSTGTLQEALCIDSNQITTLFNPLFVSSGGTGLASTTAYGLIAGGTTSTGNLQNVGTGTAGQTLRSNGASALPTWQNSTGFNEIIVTQAMSPYTWNKPANFTASSYIEVWGVAGGGGGGGAPTTSGSQAAEGGGGGGGGTFYKKIMSASLGATETVTIGAGGAGGAALSASSGTGTAGGTTSFGSHASGLGGAPGIGGTNSGLPIIRSRGLGGTASGGNLNIQGSDGNSGVVSNGSAHLNTAGGASFFAGQRALGNVNNSASGHNFGGGGAGASLNASTTGIIGGAGANGLVIIREYI